MITEFGSINLLKASEGYVARLHLKAQSESSEIEDLPPKEDSSHTTKDAAVVVPEFLAEQNEETQDLRRQTGDLSVYSYYSRAGGHGTVACMLITVALWVFCLEFSGTLTQITSLVFVHPQC
jgi:ATP-binding cassette subfamily C (CFTR/MRP) protein 1